jgi:hypothetical protein
MNDYSLNKRLLAEKATIRWSLILYIISERTTTECCDETYSDWSLIRLEDETATIIDENVIANMRRGFEYQTSCQHPSLCKARGNTP